MKKIFCDSCGIEITKSNKVAEHAGLVIKIKKKEGKPRLNVQVLVGDGTGADEETDFCKYCVIDAVNTLDDRPKCDTTDN